LTVGKGLLIAGGVGVGAYLLYRLTGGSSIKPEPAATTTTAAGNAVSGLISAIAGSIASGRPPSGPNALGPSTGQSAFWSSPAAASANYNDPNAVSNDVGSYSAGAFANYNYADTHPGTALPAGVYGPPVPGASPVASDGLMEPTEF